MLAFNRTSSWTCIKTLTHLYELGEVPVEHALAALDDFQLARGDQVGVGQQPQEPERLTRSWMTTKHNTDKKSRNIVSANGNIRPLRANDWQQIYGTPTLHCIGNASFDTALLATDTAFTIPAPYRSNAQFQR